MSTRKFIGAGQNSAHLLLDGDGYRVQQITQSSCICNMREHRVSCDAVHKRTPCDDFGFLDWNIYLQKGCNYSNEANEMM